ncbi:MAG: MG2 domain-containing protein, partial [Ignavibacteriaceae bacterium]
MTNKSTLLFVLIFSFILISLNNAQSIKSSQLFYSTSWEKVDSLERIGLTLSALEIVDKIYKTAKKDNVHPQFIKSVLYKLKFANYVEENSQVKIVNEVKKEIQESSFPSNAILESILADMYWQFYKNNRHKFQQRTETVNFENEDFQTWDLNRIVKEITKYYLSSIEQNNELQKIPLKEFEEILIFDDSEDAHLRPTLYDVLAHKALTFFINEESSLTQPVYKFVLDKENDLAIDTAFIKNNYSTKDSLSLKFYAIQLYQKLIAFHLTSNDKEALLDVDLARLNFVNRNIVLKDKSKFYFDAITYSANKFKELPHSSLICFYLAQHYTEEGKKYDPEVSDEFKWQTKYALQICDSIIAKYPGTIGAINCSNLKTEILSRSLNLQVENANLPDEPFRVLVSYKNLNKLYLRVIKLDDSLEVKEETYYQEKTLNLYKAQPVIKEWSLELPDKGDYQNHKTEIVIPALPVGKYLIMAGTDSSFSYKKNGIAYCKTWVTNLSFIKRRLNDQSVEIMALDRKSGEIITGVNVIVYFNTYLPDLRTYKFIKVDEGKTNSVGVFETDLGQYPYSAYKISLIDNFDRFESENNHDYYYNYDKELQEVKSTFFLDRAIYRPGQTVYFKGLMYKTDYKKDHDIISDKQTTVTLYDKNNQKIADTTLTTNEFGTFNGQFTIPYGRVGGHYKISNEFEQIGFSVEEYKRPKFEVKFEPVKGSYALNEKISVTGLANTFSGAKLNDVEVKFRVVRNTSFPFYNWRYRNYYNWCYRYSPSTEIVNGTIKTDNEGKFTIDFNAIPDLVVLKESNPTFNYEIYADVVDVTGETRSAQTNVTVGYVALSVDSEIPEIISSESSDEYSVITKNLNGQFESSEVSIEVYKLKTPSRVFRKRLWGKPDSFILSKNEFYNTFKFDVYDDENEYFYWEYESKVYETNLVTKENSTIKFENIDDWLPGKYLVNIKTKDKNGIPVEVTKYFTLFDPASKETPLN